MNEAAYIKKVLRKYIPKTQNVLIVKTISNELSPYLKSWAYPYFSGKSTAGSYAKGTSIIGDSDIDIFIFTWNILSSRIPIAARNPPNDNPAAALSSCSMV